MRSAWLVLGLSLGLLSLTTACGSQAADDGQEDQDIRDARKKKSLDEDDESSPEGEDAPLRPTKPSGGDNPPSTPNNPDAPPETPAAKNTCATARNIGSLSGDTGTGKVVAEGTCGEWLKVRVTEDQGSLVAYPQRVLVTLIPPVGEDLDLDVFLNEGSDIAECSLVRGSGTTEGDKTESVPLTWGETFSANNTDDSRFVNVLVKAKGACSTKSWTVIVQGNR